MATKQFLGGRLVLGTEYSGYKIGIFEPGTSTPKTTYKDSGLTVGNENTAPVVLDTNGAGQIWFDGNAKAIFYTSADAVVYTDDNINLTTTTSATGTYNLILNGSFEDDTDADGVPDNWTKTLYTAGTFTLDTSTQFHGATSAKFTSVGTGGGYLTTTSNFAISPSVIYAIGFALKSSAAAVRNVVEVLWYKADGSASSTASTTVYDNNSTNPSSWTESFYEATSPSDAYFAKVRVTGCHSSSATSGSTWFDSVLFTDAVAKRSSNTFSGTTNTISGTAILSGNTALKIFQPTNYTLTGSVGSSALTIALKDGSGADPSATSPVYVPFRDVTLATGTTTWIAVTAATSLVVSSGSTLGSQSGVLGRLGIVGFNDGGTFRLGVIGLTSLTLYYALDDFTIASSTAEGGAGGADSAGVIYTGTAVTSKAMTLLGLIESTQGTAGTWATAVSKIQLGKDGLRQFDPRLCSAWCLFNGSGTPAYVGAFNFATITDNGAGDWTLNFTTAMRTANFCALGLSGTTSSSVGAAAHGLTAKVYAVGSVQVVSTDGGSGSDDTQCNVIVFGGK